MSSAQRITGQFQSLRASIAHATISLTEEEIRLRRKGRTGEADQAWQRVRDLLVLGIEVERANARFLGAKSIEHEISELSRLATQARATATAIKRVAEVQGKATELVDLLTKVAKLVG